jgi:hypothetical protein
MKKYNNYILAIFGLLIFSGCMKDDYQSELSYNVERPIAQFLKGDSSGTTATLGSLALDFSDAFAEFDLTNIGFDPRNNLGGDIVVEIVKDDSIIAAYNSANETELEPLPDSVGNIVANSFTFNDTKKNSTVRLNVKSAGLVGHEYALGLRISSVTKGEISKVKNVFIAQIKVKNAYEAVYNTEGVRTNYGGPTINDPITGTFSWGPNFEKYLSTVDATTCETLTADGVDYMLLTVNNDNTVTVSSSPNGGFETSNDGPCTYDPVTRTFNLNYKYFNASGRIRKMTETMVRF